MTELQRRGADHIAPRRSSRLNVILGLIALSAPATIHAQGKIVVGPTVMVSSARPGWEHAEYAAHGDPANANRVMVCVMRFSQTQNLLTTVVYNSVDGGKRWKLAQIDSSGRWNGVFDPACAYGPNGEAYFVTLPTPDTARTDTTDYSIYRNWRMGGDHGMHFFRSPDGGRTWEPRSSSVSSIAQHYESITQSRRIVDACTSI